MNFWHKKIQPRGFTLVEIMVVISIIAIIGGALAGFDYKKNQVRNTLLSDSESLAFSVRDMQNRTSSFISNEAFPNSGYGAFFNLSNPSIIEFFYKNNSQFFSDTELSLSSSGKPDDDLFLSSGNHISKICLNNCGTQVDKLAIYFIKPKPYAYFSYLGYGGSYHSVIGQDTPINKVCIEISGGADEIEKRRIEVYYIGQISFSYEGCQ